MKIEQYIQEYKATTSFNWRILMQSKIDKTIHSIFNLTNESSSITRENNRREGSRLAIHQVCIQFSYLYIIFYLFEFINSETRIKIFNSNINRIVSEQNVSPIIFAGGLMMPSKTDNEWWNKQQCYERERETVCVCKSLSLARTFSLMYWIYCSSQRPKIQ